MFNNLLVVLFITLISMARAQSIFDYIPFGKALFGYSDGSENSRELSLQKVPYEVEVTDEKFIEQAAKFTGVSLSDLDKCQHRVVFKLQTECHKLNDEELAKLAVKLLNCQSEIEGRTVYPCTEQMPIRECTSSMDPDTWNSYLLMSNRARAVCYSIRQAQFRGLTELTVNKLMDTAHEQISIMTRLKDGQFKIEKATSETIDKVVKGNEALKKQQDDIRQAQFFGQLALEDNIRRLADEKQLILEGHDQLTEMTKDVKAKLDEAAKQLDAQSEERKDNHQEILKDLIEIQKQAQAIFSRIEESSRFMLEQSSMAAKQYEATLNQLSQVNSTVYGLVEVVSTTRAVLEEKLMWLSQTLGGTDNAVERLYLFLSHISYLILAMISCSFLQVPVPGRIALVVLVPLNLIVAIQQGITNALTFIGLSVVLLSFIIVQTIFNFGLLYWQNRKPRQCIEYKEKQSILNHNDSSCEENEESVLGDSHIKTPLGNSTVSDSYSYTNGYTYKRYNLDTPEHESENGDYDHFAQPTPPLSRLGRSSRSKTPSSPRSVLRQKCSANTRMGTPCKSIALLGRDFCYRHQTGSSVIVK